MQFSIGDTVSVKDRGDVYLACIKKIDAQKGCFIHFIGWSSRQDRWEDPSGLSSSEKASKREQERKRKKKAEREEQEKKRAKKAAESSARVYMDTFGLGARATTPELAQQFHEQGLVHFQVMKFKTIHHSSCCCCCSLTPNNLLGRTLRKSGRHRGRRMRQMVPTRPQSVRHTRPE